MTGARMTGSVTGARDPILFAGIGVAASAYLYFFFYYPLPDFDYNFGYGYGRDFINFWGGGRLALDGRVGLLTQPDAYNAWLSAQVPGNAGQLHTFSYMPNILPLLAVFGLANYAVALALWTVANLVAFAGAAVLVGRDRNRPMTVMLALLSPAVAINAFQGQMAAFLGALLFSALMLLDRRPALAGILLGLLTIKPQLGVVAGLIVLIDRRWVTAVVAALTAGALVVLSIVLFGIQPWLDFQAQTVAAQTSFIAELTAGFRYFMITPYAGFRALGASNVPALILHALCAVVLLAAALSTWRRSADRLVAMLLASIASLLVTPYANVYDLCLVALPLAALVAQRGLPPTWAGMVLGALWLVPAFSIPVAVQVLWGVPVLVTMAAFGMAAAALPGSPVEFRNTPAPA
jgi:hypothetical protein